MDEDAICGECGHRLGDAADEAVYAAAWLPVPAPGQVSVVRVQQPRTVLHWGCFAENTEKYRLAD